MDPAQDLALSPTWVPALIRTDTRRIARNPEVVSGDRDLLEHPQGYTSAEVPSCAVPNQGDVVLG